MFDASSGRCIRGRTRRIATEDRHEGSFVHRGAHHLRAGPRGRARHPGRSTGAWARARRAPRRDAAGHGAGARRHGGPAPRRGQRRGEARRRGLPSRPAFGRLHHEPGAPALPALLRRPADPAGHGQRLRLGPGRPRGDELPRDPAGRRVLGHPRRSVGVGGDGRGRRTRQGRGRAADQGAAREARPARARQLAGPGRRPARPCRRQPVRPRPLADRGRRQRARAGAALAERAAHPRRHPDRRRHQSRATRAARCWTRRAA